MSDLDDWLNIRVDGAINNNAFGYHHGPTINNNMGWQPAEVLAARANPNAAPKDRIVSLEQNKNAPNPGQMISQINTLVCPIVVGPPDVQCGVCFKNQPAFRRHLRQQHPGATINLPGRIQASQEERVFGDATIRRYIRDGHWRRAKFLEEPGRALPESVVGRYCDELTEIAQNDPEFAARFGTNFHRESVR